MGVVFSCQQGGEPLFLDGGLDFFHAGGAFLQQGFVRRFVGQLDEGHRVVIIADQTLVFIDGILEGGCALGGCLRGLHVVPKAVGGGPLFQLGCFPP